MIQVYYRCLGERPKTSKGGTKVDQGRTKKTEVDWRRGTKRPLARKRAAGQYVRVAELCD